MDITAYKTKPCNNAVLKTILKKSVENVFPSQKIWVLTGVEVTGDAQAIGQ